MVDKISWAPEPYDRRGTMGLLYGCLATILLCTWSTMHLNVPAPSDSEKRKFFRKLKWTVYGIVAPEIISTIAITERWHARRKKKLPQALYPSEPHAFLSLMDGYGVKVQNPNDEIYVFQLYENQLESLLQRESIELPSEEDIQDKSKSNWISNVVVVFQISWFLAQLIGRAAQHLPTSPLELFTAGLVVCATITHVAWWNKPQDVERLFILGKTFSESGLERYGIYTSQGRTAARSLFEVLNWDSRTSWKKGGLFSALVFLCIIAPFGTLHLLAWNFDFPTAAEHTIWRVGSVGCCAANYRNDNGLEWQYSPL